ncbi:hypothetical protein V6N13_131189 [Hibiscus sabdariffa]
MSGLHRSSSPPLKNGHPPQELLDDLCSRFVLNVPKEDQHSFERILFLVEYAHWFFEDNTNLYHYEKGKPFFSKRKFGLEPVTSSVSEVKSCDVLRPYVAHIDDIFKDFTDYKVRVPVTGAIILDKTYELCILVKGWKGTSWSFPRGKKNKDEEDHACAIREVLEETGFDVSGLLNKDEYIEVIFGQQRVRLYIISGVKDDTAFAPLTKKEISIFKIMDFKAFSPSTSKIRHVLELKLRICVWKAKNSSTGSNSMTVESQSTKYTSNANSIDTGPGKSFRNFRFDSAAILRALEAGFSA